VTGHDPPGTVVEQDDEDRIAILGESLYSVELAAVGPSQSSPEDVVP
jgi:hypothetical protein